jgi:hypothetical protein
MIGREPANQTEGLDPVISQVKGMEERRTGREYTHLA